MPCIYFHPDGYTTEGRQVMGRHVAGESFLEGLLRFGSELDSFALQVESDKHLEVFEKVKINLGSSIDYKKIKRSSIGNLREHEVVFYPGPGLAEWAKIRSLYGDSNWSICGITHTISSDRAMDAIADNILAPVHPWDALICTSQAVKKSTEILFERQIKYMSDRFKANKFPIPQLPVIPLGINSDAFDFSKDEACDARQQLGIDADEIVVLYVGRLSFHAKANPYPMHKALQLACNEVSAKVTLIECGWFYNSGIEDAFDQVHQELSPNIRLLKVDGRIKDLARKAWCSADIFCSLVDNIQETFGITPVEAMASGLPVIVSDWDGYKETVRDGVDGFRIPTAAPSHEVDQGFHLQYASKVIDYDTYLGLTSLQISVCLNSAKDAFKRLLSDPELRKKMGENGRRRVIDSFDWKVIIPQYETLWRKLNVIRTNFSKDAKLVSSHPYPSRPDPFQLFGHYPTRLISMSSLLSISQSKESAFSLYEYSLRLKIFSHYRKYLLDSASVLQLFSLVESLNGDVKLIISQCKLKSRPIVLRTLGYLLKIGALSLRVNSV